MPLDNEESLPANTTLSRRGVLQGGAALWAARSGVATLLGSVLACDEDTPCTEIIYTAPPKSAEAKKPQRPDETGQLKDELEKPERAREIEKNFKAVNHLEFPIGFEIVFDEDMSSMSPRSLLVLKEVVARKLGVPLAELHEKTTTFEHGRSFEGRKSMFSLIIFHGEKRVAKVSWTDGIINKDKVTLICDRDDEIVRFEAKMNEMASVFEFSRQSKRLPKDHQFNLWTRSKLPDGRYQEDLNKSAKGGDSMSQYMYFFDDGKPESVMHVDSEGVYMWP